ncbi:hypothetical protein [Rhizorhabdus argentea]
MRAAVRDAHHGALRSLRPRHLSETIDRVGTYGEAGADLILMRLLC